MDLSNAVGGNMHHERVASDIPHSVLESGLNFKESNLFSDRCNALTRRIIKIRTFLGGQEEHVINGIRIQKEKCSRVAWSLEEVFQKPSFIPSPGCVGTSEGPPHPTIKMVRVAALVGIPPPP